MERRDKLARLKAACVRGKLDIHELLAECRAGTAQLFETEEAVAITSLLVSGPYRVCYVMVVAGTLAGVAAINRVVEEFARQHDCHSIRTVGRPGFTKSIVNKIDPEFKIVGVMYEKAL